jgi:hypothetical protein
MSWKPEVKVQGEWHRNGLLFETEIEAMDNAHHLCLRWTHVTGYRAVKVREPVNYYWRDGRLTHVDEARDKRTHLREGTP